MTGKYQVLSRPSVSEGGAKQDHGCFGTRLDAEQFMSDATREHPERTYECGECSHPEHQTHPSV